MSSESELISRDDNHANREYLNGIFLGMLPHSLAKTQNADVPFPSSCPEDESLQPLNCSPCLAPSLRVLDYSNGGDTAAFQQRDPVQLSTISPSLLSPNFTPHAINTISANVEASISDLDHLLQDYRFADQSIDNYKALLLEYDSHSSLPLRYNFGNNNINDNSYGYDYSRSSVSSESRSEENNNNIANTGAVVPINKVKRPSSRSKRSPKSIATHKFVSSRHKFRTPKQSRRALSSFIGRGTSNGHIPTDEEKLLLALKDKENLQWKEIAARFYSTIGKNYQVPALQMRYKRLRERMRVWKDSDVEALRMAHKYWTETRFEVISAKMLDFGSTERWTPKLCERKWKELFEQDDEAVQNGEPLSDAALHCKERDEDEKMEDRDEERERQNCEGANAARGNEHNVEIVTFWPSRMPHSARSDCGYEQVW